MSKFIDSYKNKSSDYIQGQIDTMMVINDFIEHPDNADEKAFDVLRQIYDNNDSLITDLIFILHDRGEV